MVGVVGGATAVGAALAGPVVGAEGLVRSLKSVSLAELAERERALTNALSQMATQQPFRAALTQTAAEKIRGGFSSPADAVLNVRVDDLRLERAGSSEGSYFLRIRTHARLIRAADGTVCFERSAEYRSGKCLFLDWTTHGAVESVAETGYQTLSRYYIDQLVAGPSYSRAH